ncbi:MAG TPA: amidohydrolase family protein [Chloroflexota bacterium]|nr:amidohydrolase family protein [Chloroflexota bacterium]
MYQGRKVIDVHGHMSTPPHFRAFAYNLIALRTPDEFDLDLSDEQLEMAQKRHLRMLDERGIDIQLLSARPVAMMHWERPFIVEKWTRVTNNVIHQICRLHPDRFVGIAQLPQCSTRDTSNCLEELDRCVEELGFVGALVNPDPGGDRQTPGMDKEYWFPLYERAQTLDIPLIVHPSISRDPRLESIPHSYQYNNLTEETLAVLLLEHSNVFELFPRLKVVVCHCGGALNRIRARELERSGERAGGQVGMAVREEAPRRRGDVTQNLFFDTCAYDPDFLATAIKQRGPERMLFGTEVPGTGSDTLNPETGRPSDDLIPVIDRMEFLATEDKVKILYENALRVFPRLRVD